ncbi:unnamed protein product [Rotaria socialis]|uniref:Uncharacterized protein n=1 Tax=Rotaria socialis TaxID=392032 RepID=A0A817TJV3_9BILA|nr:unnamed protein product [Rotaria socialis]CAF4483745.1 unnamed protein product [Rotaria socialis]
MISNTIHCEIIANNLIEPTTIQLDEKHHALYVLTNQLTRIDLNKDKNNAEIVYQYNRKFQQSNNQNQNDDEEEDQYSQGESDDERDIPRVSDPFDDSEPSTDDDDETILNRRNWRRYGWRIYQLDNPCSILFLPENNQLVVLNEGVITFLTIQLEDHRPFVEGPSKNIFCYDFDVFNSDANRKSVQPWSIAPTLKINLFVFSLLDDCQLYLLDMQNETTMIRKLTTTSIYNCPYLVFHCQSNNILVYNSTEILAVSLDNQTVVEVNLEFMKEKKLISSITIDKMGYIYILSQSILFKCIWQSQLHLIACLGKLDVLISSPQIIVTDQGNEFYFSDMETACIYRSKTITT